MNFKPTFLLIGVQGGGTTWLAGCLQQHPEICMNGKSSISSTMNTLDAAGNGMKPTSNQVTIVLLTESGLRNTFLMMMPSDGFAVKLRLKTMMDRINRNKAGYPYRLTPRERKQLLDKYFREDIREFSNYIEKDLSIWN